MQVPHTSRWLQHPTATSCGSTAQGAAQRLVSYRGCKLWKAGRAAYLSASQQRPY